jgi:putative membrane protein
MLETILHLAALAVTILVLSRVVPGVRIRTAGTAIAVAIVFSILNFFLGLPIKALLVVPGLLTLGLLFFFVPFIVNTVVLWVTDKLMASFEIASLRPLLLSAGAITLVNWVFHMHRSWGGYVPHGGHIHWV